MIAPDIDKLRNEVSKWEKDLVRKLGPLAINLEEFYDKVPLPDGHENPLKIVRPKSNPETGCPLIVLFHGGGFGAGSVEQPSRPARTLQANSTPSSSLQLTVWLLSISFRFRSRTPGAR